MSKKLVLAEKPSVGRDIAKVLKCQQKGKGYFEGEQYIITWALGHLVTLADPEKYHSKYQEWKLEDLPMIPSPLQLEVIKSTRGQYQLVSSLLKRKDISEIIIATDAGREGELVARWIIEKSGVKKTIKRLWISSVTDQAIKKGFLNLKKGDDYLALYASAQARSEADWYVGMNATRALTCRYNAQLSCGRVQTPTLAMIAKREKEIQAFKSQPFYQLTAVTPKLSFAWVDSGNQSTHCFDYEKINEIKKKIALEKLRVTQVVSKEKIQAAPKLYDLTELQREANKRYDFSAKKTLNLMQKLYEQHKLLTYPRTDSRYLSSDIVETLADRVRACLATDYKNHAQAILRKSIKGHSSFVDNSKVSDHHAIIPTEESMSFNQLSADERKIYDMVVQRFLAVLMPPLRYEEKTLYAQMGSEGFKAKGKRIIEAGWSSLNTTSRDEVTGEEMEDQIIPQLEKGDTLEVKHLHVKELFTQPPAYFTEGTLLTAMEKPSSKMNCGIGTVATRADIIEKLMNSFLIEKKGKHLHVTTKGKQLLEIVPSDLKEAELTARWEEKLEAISKGNLSKKHFIDDIKKYTELVVREIKNSESTFKHDNITHEKCPDCGKFLLAVQGKKGKMNVCQDRSCGYRKTLTLTTNSRCPQCHKKLELRGEGEQKTFFCKCGHREKISAFQKRKNEEKSKGNHNDLKKFLEDQKKAIQKDPEDSPFAILKKLK